MTCDASEGEYSRQMGLPSPLSRCTWAPGWWVGSTRYRTCSAIGFISTYTNPAHRTEGTHRGGGQHPGDVSIPTEAALGVQVGGRPNSVTAPGGCRPQTPHRRGTLATDQRGARPGRRQPNPVSTPVHPLGVRGGSVPCRPMGHPPAHMTRRDDLGEAQERLASGRGWGTQGVGPDRGTGRPGGGATHIHPPTPAKPY